MPNASNFLDQFVKSGMDSQDPKKSSVAAAAQAKRQSLEGYRTGAAMDAGFDRPENEYDPTDPVAAVGYVAGSGDYTRDSTASRSIAQAVGDTFVDAAGAVITTPLSIANIGVNALDPGAGAAVSRFLEDGMASSRDRQSAALAARRRAYAERAEVTSEHNKVLYEEERGSYGDTVAGFRRLGRDIIDGFSNMDSPTALSTVGSGIGSLALGGPLGKLAKIASGGRLGVLTGVGAMEGAGAQQDTMTKILGMSHAELMQNSAAYRQAIETGTTEDDAREAIASTAGLTAAAIQGPVAAAIGKVTGISHFESNPLAFGARPRELVSNLLREAVEEGSQSGVGTAAGNLAVGVKANDNQSILDGVGESIAQGVVGGIGAAGTTQAPGAALSAAVAAVVIPTKAAIKGGKAIIARGAQLVDNITAASADKIIDTAATTVTTPEVVDTITQAVSEIDATDAEKDEALNYVNGLMGNLSPERVAAFRAAMENIHRDDITPQEREEAGLAILDTQREAEAMKDPNLPAAFAKLQEKDPNNPILKQITEFGVALNAMASHPNAKAVDNGPEAQTASVQSESLGDGDVSIDSEAGVAPDDRVVSNTARLAEHRPDQADPDTVNKILFHADKGDISLGTDERRSLESAAAYANAVTERRARAQRLGLKSADEVSRELITGKDDPAFEKMPSMSTLLRNVNYAMRSGNTTKAKASLQQMLELAQHMQNKVEAINKSLALGGGLQNKVNFVGRNFATGRMDLQGRAGITPTSINSVHFAQRVGNDAKALTAVANYLALAHKELGLKPVTQVGLDKSLDADAADVVSNYVNGTTNVADKLEVEPSTSTDTAPIKDAVSTPEPAETGQPKGGDTSVEVKTTPAGDLRLFHGSASNDLSLDGVDTDRLATKQNKKGRTYGGFYATNKVDEAEGYAGTEGSVYELELRPDAKVATTDKDIMRLSQQDRDAFRAQGVDILVGKDVRGRTEYVILNRDAIKAFGKKKEAPAPVVEAVTEAIEASVSKPVEKAEPKERAPAKEAGTVSVSESVEPDVKDVKEEPAPEVAAEPKSAIEQVYPGLVEKSWFYEHFLMPKDQRSNLGDIEKPLEHIIDLIGRGQTAVSRFAGRDLKNKLNADIANGFDSLFRLGGKIHDVMGKRLQKVITEKLARNLDINEIMFTQKELKVLHLTKNVDGKFEYDEKLLQGAILAGLNWVLTAGQQGRVYKDEDIADILKIDETEVSDDARAWFNNGLYLTDSVDSLAATIVRFWGVKLDQTAPVGELVGITQAMAKEVFVGLKAVGLIEIAPPFEVTTDTEKGPVTKKYLQVKSTIDPDLKNSVSSFADLLDQIISVDPDPDIIIGEPSTQVDEFQDRARIVPTTKMQRAVQKAVQKTAHTLNMLGVSFQKSLGPVNALELYGHGNIEEQGSLNKRDWEAKKGFNLTIRGAYDHMEQLVARLDNAAKVDGTPLEKMKVFYRYAFSKVGRLHAQGSYNPQASKFMREISLPSESTLDLTNRKAHGVFMLAVGQHWGVKVHKQSRAATLKDVEKLAGTKFAQSLKIMQQWLKDGAQRSFNEEDMAVFKQEFGNQAAPGAVHAAIEYARFQNASKADRKNFTTQLYVEADGVTDGPINALMHLASGSFSPHWIKMMAKGGLFIGNAISTLSEHINGGKESDGSKDDLYTAAAKKTKDALANFRTKMIKTNPKIADQTSKLLFVMNELLDGLDFEQKTGKVDIDRSLTKNPLTVVVYGSGERGLASKLINEMMTRFYERLSEGSVTPELEAAMNAVTDHYIGRDKKNDTLYVGSPPTKPKSKGTSALDFELSRQQIDNLRDNVLKLFIPSLQEGINAVIGDEVRASKDALRDAVQVQSIFISNAYRRAIDEVLGKSEKQSHIFLSQTQMDQIHAKVANDFHVLIETSTQTFYPAASERAEVSEPGVTPVVRIELSRTLDERLSTPYRMQAPADAGVRGIPYLVIGTGDGQMIMNIVMDGFAPEGALYVFDGVNVKLATAETDSQTINKAVLKGWTANPMDAVAKSFGAFAEASNLDTDSMSALELGNLLASLDVKTAEEVGPKIEQMAANLKELALQSQARKNVLAKVNVSVDHMASLEAPHKVTDQLQLDGTPEEVVQELNKLYRAELAKLKGGEVAASATEAVSEAVDEPSEDKLIVQTLKQAMIGILKTTKATPDQQRIMALAVDSIRGDGWTVVQGSLKDIQVRMTRRGVSEFDNGKGINVSGFADINDRTIYIVNESAEVMAHELVHAATYLKVLNFYSGNAVSAETSAAIGRIEGLMSEWVDATEKSRDPDIKNLREQILEQDDTADGKTAAINEFMAWVLTNESLASKAKGTLISKLGQIATKALGAIRQLVFGRYAGKIKSPGNDLFSNLEFNTQIIIAEKLPTLSERTRNVLLHSSASFGNDERLVRLGNNMATIVDTFIKQDPIDNQTKVDTAITDAAEVQNSFEANGFRMTLQERQVFTLMVEMLGTSIKLDPNALVRVQELYDHVVKNLKVEDFMSDPDDNAQRYYAEQKYNSILGNYVTITDAQGRSSLLSAFLALASVNDEFRKILINMPIPKGKRNKGKSLDELIENVGIESMHKLTRFTAGEKGTEAQTAIDSLVDRLTETVLQQENLIVQASTSTGNYVDKYNEIITGFIDKWSHKGVDKLKDVEKNTNNKYVAASASIGASILSMLNDEDASIAATGIMRMADRSKLWHWPRELMAEIIGRTTENANVYDMIKRVRSVIQQLRQQFREQMPKTIADKFSRKLSRDEWSHLFSLAKTDVITLRDHYNNMSTILGLLEQPSLMAAEITKFEGLLQKSHPNEAPLFLQKAQELADYMNNGGRITTHNLLSNAHAIAELHGEVLRKNAPRATAALVKNIDVLTSLYAYQGITQSAKDTISALVKDEAEGVDFLLAQLKGSREDEMDKVLASGLARANYIKGHVPNEQRHGVSMMIADDVRRGELELMGYKRVGDYKGSVAENSKISRGYYFAPMSGKAPFSQGIMQNVHATASGVDPMTGFSIGSMTAGTITDPYLVEAIRLRQRRNAGTTEGLKPIYDQSGKLVAWERSIEPNETLRLERNTQLHEVIGVWKGRQLEERGAVEFNHKLVDELASRWNEDKRTGNEVEGYINIFDKDELKKDKVLADAVRLITPQTRAYILDQFEEGEFWVRKSEVNDAIGYRSATVGDLWTGNTRINPEVNKQMKNFITGIFGKDSYKYAVTTEKFWQNFVSDARTTIVVRSGIVTVANMISNVYHLSAVGVPWVDIFRSLPKKLGEINHYVNTRQQYMVLDAELMAAKANNDTRLQRQTEAKMQVIKDSWSHLSIGPLLDAGEFTSISDEGISQEETLLVEGKLSSALEGWVDKLPPSVRTAGRYAIISKDTALFKGLQKSVAYGDFIAKAILFDDITKRKGKSVEDALGRISEEFVNYDRLAGRSRSYLESNGLMWFWNFKIRAMKIAVSTVRNNPLHVLLTGLVPQPDIFGSIGSVVTDNAASVTLDGRAHWSIGPSMGFNAYLLNPTVQLLS